MVTKLLLRKLNCLWLAVKSHLNNDESDGLIKCNRRVAGMMTTSDLSERKIMYQMLRIMSGFIIRLNYVTERADKSDEE